MNSYNILISYALIIAGSGLILKLLYVFYFYSVTIKKWGKAEGTILDAGIEYFRSKTDSDTEGWKLKINYSYNVSGLDYNSNEITRNIGLLSPSKSIVKQNNKEYFKGQKIIVYYNKRNPQKSIIDGNFNYNSLILILLGLLSFYISHLIRNEI